MFFTVTSEKGQQPRKKFYLLDYLEVYGSTGRYCFIITVGPVVSSTHVSHNMPFRTSLGRQVGENASNILPLIRLASAE